MPAPDQVGQGESYIFTADIDDSELENPVYSLSAKQYPDDDPLFSRTVTKTNGKLIIQLTPAETDSMAVGLWYLIIDADDGDENVEWETRIQVKKYWVSLEPLYDALNAPLFDANDAQLFAPVYYG